MADRSKIEWTDATWNPITGCTPVSAGCANCYAKRMEGRNLPGHHQGPFSKVAFHPDRLDIPIRWRKPKRIFVCSLADLFHEDVTDDQILSVWTAMGEFYDAKGRMQVFNKRPGHTYMVLTKRPERMRDFLQSRYPEHFKRTNVWLGVTAENQETADQRIPILLQTPAAKRFVSVEPMLGPVDLRIPKTYGKRSDGLWGCDSCCNGDRCDDPTHVPRGSCKTCGGTGAVQRIDWVICGQENGPGARAMDFRWPRSLLSQCRSAGVPFFMKWKRAIPHDLMIREFPNG